MQKKIIHLEHPRHHHMVGNGFRVSQYIPGYGREMSDDTSPFLMLDYNSPWQIPPQSGWHRPWVGYHPHRGFETVTIVYSWEIEHEDTAGHGGIIWPDEVQWMTAGSWLLHNEFMTEKFAKRWGVQHLAQIWIDLPRIDKMTSPKYQTLTREDISEVGFDGGRARVIAGSLQMRNIRHSDEGRIQALEILDPSQAQSLSEAKRGNDRIKKQKWAAETHSPIELYDVRFDTAWSLDLTLPEGYTTIILVTEWSVIVNEKCLENGDMVHLSREWTDIHLTTDSIAKILIMAGKPLDQSVVAHGPFVMNTEDEIRQAFEDFRSGKMG